VGETKVLGYVETDFLGNAPPTWGVASNRHASHAFLLADLRNGQWELSSPELVAFGHPTAAASRRSLPTLLHERHGRHTRPGLTWADGQVRVVYHATDSFALALSVEDPDQYVGSAVALPAAFTATEVDTGAATTQPNAFPDVVAKRPSTRRP